jgi:hypothetical protein
MRTWTRTLLLAAALPVLGAAPALAGPLAHATLSPDGRYTLIFQPDRAWSSAEVVVADDGVQGVGPASVDAPVRVEGKIDGNGPLRVTVTAEDGGARGCSWSFQVVPDAVPVEMPKILVDTAVSPVPSRRWPFGRR